MDGTYTPKQVLVLPEMRSGSMRCLCDNVANLAIGYMGCQATGHHKLAVDAHLRRINVSVYSLCTRDTGSAPGLYQG